MVARKGKQFQTNEFVTLLMMRGRPDRQVLVFRYNLALGHLRGADSQSTKVCPGLWKIEGVLLGESRQDVMFYSTAN